MGKLNLFTILLDNPQGVYYPGQALQGSVTVELNEEMKMRGVRLHFYGGARVHWSERHTTGSGKNKKTVTRHYSANETYFSYELVLFGKAAGQGGDNPTLPAGRHIYPFHYTLPGSIPSSFEGGVGRVRYWLNATIDKPWKFDHNTKKAFTVLNLLDLNTEPGATNAVQDMGSKSLCCLCCKSGPISCTFQLPRIGYVPGEAIPIRAEITNYSNRKMNRSFAELYMVVVYHATSKSKTLTRKVSEISRGEILPGDSDSWNGELLPVPPLPPSKLPGCRIIVIDYYVKLCVDPAGPAFDLEVPLRVIIGSIPLRSTLQQYGIAPPAQPAPSAPLPDSSQLYTGAGGTNMPPPSYAECVFGEVNIKDEEDSEYINGNMQYTPKYTYYDWGQHAANSTPSAPLQHT